MKRIASKYSFLVVFLIVGVFLSNDILSAETNTRSSEKIEDIKKGLKKSKSYLSTIKKMQISSVKLELILNETITEISEECCEETFEKKDRLFEIMKELKQCLVDECHKKDRMYISKKKPKKLIAVELTDEAKELLLINAQIREKNIKKLIDQRELDKSNYEKLKTAYNDLEKNNSKLKEKIANLEKKINDLEKQNQ